MAEEMAEHTRVFAEKICATNRARMRAEKAEEDNKKLKREIAHLEEISSRLIQMNLHHAHDMRYLKDVEETMNRRQMDANEIAKLKAENKRLQGRIDILEEEAAGPGSIDHADSHACDCHNCTCGDVMDDDDDDADVDEAFSEAVRTEEREQMESENGPALGEFDELDILQDRRDGLNTQVIETEV